ncbi:MAG: MerC domain-containing protein, partial [Gammaproteobacteria bacterium]|nr:MerC domain-containing protein [Gammaproteobacteria bacterium]
HQAMLWVILPAAILAFGIGCRRHKDRWVLALGMIGLVGMALSAAVLHDIVGEAGERVVTLLSAAVLIVAHYRNFQICRSSGCAHESE